MNLDGQAQPAAAGTITKFRATSFTANSARYQCAECLSTYSSSSHLRRHEAIHAGQRTFCCHFCSRRFFRADAARRHSKSCAFRGNRPIPDPKPRGKKKQACDSCARAKRGCNQGQPCEACLATNSPCTYYRSSGSSSGSSSVPGVLNPQNPITPQQEDPLPHKVPSQTSNSPPDASDGDMSSDMDSTAAFQHHKMQVQFLLNYTRPGKAMLPEFFGSPSLTPARAGLSLVNVNDNDNDNDNDNHNHNDNHNDNHNHNHNHNHLHHNDSHLHNHHHLSAYPASFLEHFDHLAGHLTPDHLTTVHLTADTTSISPELDDYLWDEISRGSSSYATAPNHPQLQQRLKDLVALLNMTHEAMSRRKQGPIQPFPVEICPMLFTVGNLLTFRQLYFDNWHANCSILHQATFDLETCSLPLLLNVLLIGATYSAPRDTASMARQFYDIAEEFAFEHEDFLEIFRSQKLSPENPSTIDALRAVFLSAVMQNWQSCVVSRRRMRSVRYSEIVSACRLLGLTAAKNEFVPEGLFGFEAFDWNAYIAAEGRVRLMCWIFLVDCQYTIFYRYPPRFMAAEMTGDLASSEDAYSAPDRYTCENLLLETQSLRRNSLSASLQMLLGNHWTFDTTSLRGSLTTLNLFTFINALNTIIFTAKSNTYGTQDLEPIRLALQRWKILWDFHIDRNGPPQVARDGFMKNAVEFWHLTNIFVKAETVQAAQPGSKNIDTDSMAEVNDLLERFEGVTI